MNKRQRDKADKHLSIDNEIIVPRHVRCYDNDGRTVDRYTIVYTGKQGKGEYVHSSEHPNHPQGVWMNNQAPTYCDGRISERIDRPTYSHLGKKIPFTALPEKVRMFVLIDYCMYNWDIDLAAWCNLKAMSFDIYERYWEIPIVHAEVVGEKVGLPSR